MWTEGSVSLESELFDREFATLTWADAAVPNLDQDYVHRKIVPLDTQLNKMKPTYMSSSEVCLAGEMLRSDRGRDRSANATRPGGAAMQVAASATRPSPRGGLC